MASWLRKFLLVLIIAAVPATAVAQNPPGGLAGNAYKLLGKTLEDVRRFCRYHGGALYEGEMANEYVCVKRAGKDRGTSL